MKFNTHEQIIIVVSLNSVLFGHHSSMPKNNNYHLTHEDGRQRLQGKKMHKEI